MTGAATVGAATSTTQRLVVDHVTHRYMSKGSQVHALADIDLVIEPGEFVCVAGPSGCGKTTLLQLLAGFITPTEGEITIDGKQITAPGAERGVVFQQSNLYPWLSVLGNVELGPRLRGVNKATRRADAHRYLEMVGLADFVERRPYELSGGMQQRCQIARVLANDPKIVLMDEPFGALDALTRERLQLELLNIWRDTHKTIFFITHSVEEAIFLGSRVIVMSARPGRIVFDEPVSFSQQVGERLGAELRSLPEFTALRDRVSSKIYESAAH
ncbi:ABC transporter ATP-binding protein [Mycolicibacterium agri]|uniref:ABC transporter ATP-binding protein n=2 Tax=Mycolicibacterium agri TaxID=36811 RepID=A0A7I9W032_MYCAG|nr:ABC transporter ATP-binding protein [Mycolicibacterium agri]GFG50940.1 ABC transporter ATP-binding protein [Mycolicibacterium agri]